MAAAAADVVSAWACEAGVTLAQTFVGYKKQRNHRQSRAAFKGMLVIPSMPWATKAACTTISATSSASPCASSQPCDAWPSLPLRHAPKSLLKRELRALTDKTHLEKILSQI